MARKTGKMVASHAMKIHNEETKANWTSVKVAGLSKAIKMDLEEVFVRADEVYHNRHRIISFGETGARRASAISWAFWLTLPLRPLIVRIASVRLFCRLCPRGAVDQPLSDFEAGRHRSEGRGGAPFAHPGGFKGLSGGDSPRGVSMKSGNFSITGE